MSSDPRHNGFWVSWIVVLAFLLGLMGTGYAMLDAKKADRDLVLQMAQDIRQLRDLFIPRESREPRR